MIAITNPILKGFNPDPSIIRVGSDYYIATSTFEWFPGVQIHHSKDLNNWELVARPLNRLSQLPLDGLPDSCGVWAPCLSYDEGTFYLVYSIVQQFEDLRGNTPNYLVTSKDILGPWSDPIPLGNYGFDGSLFHDSNGRKWFTSMKVNPEKGKIFGGIVLQEYNATSKKLIGPIHQIFESTELGLTEAPHIYQKNGYYYLLLAEGGTEYGHAITMVRSKVLTGPYEVHPENPIITARHSPEHPLQKAGHGDLVETENGKTYCTFLVGRPLSIQGRCTLGRETAMAEMEWRDDGWLYGKKGKLPPLTLQATGKSQISNSKFQRLIKDDFDGPELDINFQTLRSPLDESWASLRHRKSHLRIHGRKGLDALSAQSLVARRVQSFSIQASTCIHFKPKTQGQMAGLVCYYNTHHWIYLHITVNEKKQRVVCIKVCDKGKITSPIDCLLISETGAVELSVRWENSKVQFFIQEQHGEMEEIGPELDDSILSDDYVRNEKVKYMPAFTGAFVGMACQDLQGRGAYADFDWFTYEEI